MSDPFIGEIKMFGGTFAPRGWALCNGQLLAISQNQALFSLVGTYYGGDGRTTFGLPDLRGRVPIHQGSGPGLTPRSIGDKVGVERVTLTPGELPAHSHDLRCAQARSDTQNPHANVLARGTEDLYGPADNLVELSPSALSTVGGSQQHNNMQPFIGINFIIALQGVFPSRN